MDLDVAVCAESVGGELEDVPGGIAQRPVSKADLRAGGVVQPDPLGVQAGVRAGVGTGGVVVDLVDLYAVAGGERRVDGSRVSAAVTRAASSAAADFIGSPRWLRDGKDL